MAKKTDTDDRIMRWLARETEPRTGRETGMAVGLSTHTASAALMRLVRAGRVEHTIIPIRTASGGIHPTGHYRSLTRPATMPDWLEPRELPQHVGARVHMQPMVEDECSTS